MTGSPIFSVNFSNWENRAKPNYHMSIKFIELRKRNHVLWHLELFWARLPVNVFKTLNDRQSCFFSKFRMTFLNRHMIVWFSWIFSICEIYWEYGTAGHLVFWKPWPAAELKKVPSVTKYSFVFWAQRKPNAILEIYKAFQDRFTFLNRHMII